VHLLVGTDPDPVRRGGPANGNILLRVRRRRRRRRALFYYKHTTINYRIRYGYGSPPYAILI